MADQVEVSPELLRQASAKADAINTSIIGIVNSLMGSTNGKGKPWGTDIYGRDFDKAYTAAETNLGKLSASLAQSAANNADGQQQSGKKLTNTDQTSAGAF
ncbi:hypothetical protein ACTWPB_04260 [Nocardia sp. IBHARD005]|uniref:hypothetical protein n=1 Tax=Nocardia sp. IBHARD005 TaxID=3457765 RepID=UPI004057F95D